MTLETSTPSDLKNRIATAIKLGVICFECGEYVKQPKGQPQVCNRCFNLRKSKLEKTPPPHPNDTQRITMIVDRCVKDIEGRGSKICPVCFKKMKSRKGVLEHVRMKHDAPTD